MKAKTKTTKNLKKSLARSVKHGVKMAVVPHQENDYRPHIVRRYGLIAIIFAVLFVQLVYNGLTSGDVLGQQTDITVSSLLEQTNRQRLDNGEPALSINNKLNQAAYLKAQDMLAKQYWAHSAPDGTQPWKWLADSKYNYDEAGENLAKNYTSTSAVMTAWMGSPEHKANILKDNYKDVGFAVVNGELDGKPTSLVVAFYGLPAVTDLYVANTPSTFSNPPVNNKVDVLTQFAVMYQSLSPAAVGALVLIIFTAIIAFITHAYREKLPKSLRKSWYKHHGLYKGIGLLVFGFIVIFMYSVGQI